MALYLETATITAPVVRKKSVAGDWLDSGCAEWGVHAVEELSSASCVRPVRAPVGRPHDGELGKTSAGGWSSGRPSAAPETRARRRGRPHAPAVDQHFSSTRAPVARGCHCRRTSTLARRSSRCCRWPKRERGYLVCAVVAAGIVVDLVLSVPGDRGRERHWHNTHDHGVALCLCCHSPRPHQPRLHFTRKPAPTSVRRSPLWRVSPVSYAQVSADVDAQPCGFEG